MRLARPVAGRCQQPANGERLAPLTFDLDWHLVGGATNAARLDLEHRGRIGDRPLEDLKRILAGPVLDGLRARRT